MDKLHHYLNEIHTRLRVMSLRQSGMAPKRDWYILLSATVVVGSVLLGVGLFQYHLSNRIVNDDSMVGTSVEKIPDAEALAEAIGTYRERAVTFETLRATPRPAPKVGVGVQVVDEVTDEGSGEATEQGTSTKPELPVRAD